MRKSIFLTLLLAAFFVVSANPVDVSTAKVIGAKFLQASTNVKSADLQLVSTYNIGRGEAAFYVFNADNGFVIVSADDCARPILAYSDEGCFNPKDLPIQMQEYLEDYVEQIRYGIENSITADEKTAKQWDLVKAIGRISDDRGTPVVGPLVSAQWGQGTAKSDQNLYRRYNIKCPEDSNGPNGHTVTGCVATAMGQIMHYHKHPATGTGSHSYTPKGYSTQTANFGATTYDWTNMPDMLTTNSSETQNNAVATLLWHCGVSVNMMYGAGGSGAYSTDVPDALQIYFNYSDEMSHEYRADNDDAVWMAKIKACLDKGRPIYYSGRSLPNDGHAFVCDGYDNQDFLHFNWGWNGSPNSYYALTSLNPSSYHFDFEHSAIFNIHPASAEASTYTVAANPNNEDYGSASVSGTLTHGSTVTVIASAKEGYRFNFWSENGVAVSTDNSYSFELKYNRNLVANFSTPNNITITPSVYGSTGGTVSAAANYSYGENVTVDASADENYTFCYWLEDNEIVSSEASYSFKATGDRNLVARFEETSSVCEIIYLLIDQYGDGWQGNKLNVKYEDTFTETMELKSGPIATYTRKVVDGRQVALSWVLGMYVEECQIALTHGNGVVFYEKTNINSEYTYNFTMNSSASSSDVFNGATTSWSTASNWESGVLPATTAIVDIKSNVEVDADVTVAALNLYADNTLTVKNGRTLTVTGAMAKLSGTHIVIEEGGQLVNSIPNVDVTVEKYVTNWTTTPSDNGWYAISTPINNMDFAHVTNLTDEIHNIYRYNEATMTWENYKNDANLFDGFENGRGYLYRRNAAAMLKFNGNFNTSFVTYNLTYSAANDNLKGFHLVGNPYTHNIYKGANTAFYNYNYLEDGFYSLQTDGTWLAGTDNSTPIAPCQAVLVQAKNFADNETLYIVNSTSSGSSKDAENIIKFTVSNSKYADVAYAIIKEGRGLNKIEHRNEEAQMLYVRNNDEDFAVADIDETTKTFDLNFKAATTGKYTLNVNADGDFSYLHIIDKFTGADVDMLVENDYSFIASSQDDENRFSVCLDKSGTPVVSDNSTFAFQNGNEIIVMGEGTLQIFDLTGRMVSTRRVDGIESIGYLAQGVYILRLVGHKSKTQTIIVK